MPKLSDLNPDAQLAAIEAAKAELRVHIEEAKAAWARVADIEKKARAAIDDPESCDRPVLH